jgi:hypothetical protein
LPGFHYIGLGKLESWLPESIDAERRFRQPHAKLLHYAHTKLHDPAQLAELGAEQAAGSFFGRKTARVVRQPQGSPEGFLIPVEFETPSHDFWHISFPPSDWNPADS